MLHGAGPVPIAACACASCGFAQNVCEEQMGAQVTFPHLDGEIRDGRHHMQVRVYYEDTDFSDWTLS
jgi:hypothetical protein